MVAWRWRPVCPVAVAGLLLLWGACGLQDGVLRVELVDHDSPFEQVLAARLGLAASRPVVPVEAAPPALSLAAARPREPGHLPGEFSRPRMLLLAWPRLTPGLEPYLVELIASAVEEVPAIVVHVPDAAAAAILRARLRQFGADTSGIHFIMQKLDSVWIRDYGPLVLRTASGGHRVVDFRYDGRPQDDSLPARLARAWSLPLSRPPMELEGGNLLSDGAGHCLVSDTVIEYNSLSAARIRRILKRHVGCRKTFIVEALSGEETGHVDLFATFTAPGEVLVGRYAAADDPVNAQILDRTARRLGAAGLAVRRVPMPRNDDGVYRSHVNSLALGHKVLVPVYADDRRYQELALQIFQRAYPGRAIIPIDSTKVIQWGGAVHCVTMTVH